MTAPTGRDPHTGAWTDEPDLDEYGSPVIAEDDESIPHDSAQGVIRRALKHAFDTGVLTDSEIDFAERWLDFVIETNPVEEDDRPYCTGCETGHYLDEEES